MNPYENISDPVEMLKVMYREKDEDCLIKNRPNQVSLVELPPKTELLLAGLL